MIKKYLRLFLLSKVSRLSSVQVQGRSPVNLTPNLNQSTIFFKNKPIQLLAPARAGLIGKKPTGYMNITMSIGTLLILQGVMLLPAQAASTVKTGQRVLMVEMTPALCSLQPTRARMRQCLEGYSLTVSGLDMGYGERCGRGSEPRLTPLQLKVVNRVMPDTTVRSQAWQHYGICSPLSASSYFRQITNYAGALKLPAELNTGNSYTVSKSRFINQMTHLNRGMSSASIDLVCQAGNRRQQTLTEIHVCYEGSGFGTCHDVVDNCGSKFVISGGK
ncbi:hypothetical protein ACI2I3_05180 [Psychrobacter namhaensis]|uniref:Uncharacterized protein n=1 Tax=Psychrobacter namhaensis TaxID=292734 RepID=A0ABW8L7L6_9GAMM|nr:hypothetical protein [Psychrobacter sp. CCUG 69069]